MLDQWPPHKTDLSPKFSSGLSLNIFDFVRVRGPKSLFQCCLVVDGTVYFPFYMTLVVYPKVAKSFIVKISVVSTR